MQSHLSLWQLSGTLFKAGALGFGGPVGLIAVLERTLCHEHRWLDLEEFRRAVVLCKLLPGPTAYQVSVWVGKRLKGSAGAIVAATSFIAPAFLLVCLLAFLWEKASAMPAFYSALEGLRIAAWFLLVQGSWVLSRGQLGWRGAPGFLLGFLVAALAPKWEPVAIFAAGFLPFLFIRNKPGPLLGISPVLLLLLFWIHAKAALTVFGTGLAVIPALQSEMIERGWMTLPKFLDGLTIAQATPGPITILSTYVGLSVAGFPGAVVATIGMYLPGLILVGWVLPVMLQKVGEARLKIFYGGALPVVLGCLWGSSLKLFFFSSWNEKSLALLAVGALVQVLLRLPVAVFFGGFALASVAIGRMTA